jgi:hypothetical protein
MQIPRRDSAENHWPGRSFYDYLLQAHRSKLGRRGSGVESFQTLWLS